MAAKLNIVIYIDNMILNSSLFINNHLQRLNSTEGTTLWCRLKALCYISSKKESNVSKKDILNVNIEWVLYYYEFLVNFRQQLFDDLLVFVGEAKEFGKARFEESMHWVFRVRHELRQSPKCPLEIEFKIKKSHFCFNLIEF